MNFKDMQDIHELEAWFEGVCQDDLTPDVNAIRLRMEIEAGEAWLKRLEAGVGAPRCDGLAERVREEIKREWAAIHGEAPKQIVVQTGVEADEEAAENIIPFNEAWRWRQRAAWPLAAAAALALFFLIPLDGTKPALGAKGPSNVEMLLASLQGSTAGEDIEILMLEQEVKALEATFVRPVIMRTFEEPIVEELEAELDRLEADLDSDLAT